MAVPRNLKAYNEVFGFSPLTARAHLKHTVQKLGVETRTAAAIRALETLGDVDGAGAQGSRQPQRRPWSG